MRHRPTHAHSMEHCGQRRTHLCGGLAVPWPPQELGKVGPQGHSVGRTRARVTERRRPCLPIPRLHGTVFMRGRGHTRPHTVLLLGSSGGRGGGGELGLDYVLRRHELTGKDRHGRARGRLHRRPAPSRQRGGVHALGREDPRAYAVGDSGSDLDGRPCIASRGKHVHLPSRNAPNTTVQSVSRTQTLHGCRGSARDIQRPIGCFSER